MRFVPAKVATPSDTVSAEVERPPITGSFMTCHECAVFEPSKVARTTGSAVA